MIKILNIGYESIATKEHFAAFARDNSIIVPAIIINIFNFT